MPVRVYARRLIAIGLIFVLFDSWALADDTIELSTGAKINGRIVSVSKSSLSMEVKVGTKTFVRKYNTRGIKQILVNGEPKTLEELAELSASKTLTEKEVRKLIDEQGRTPPDWFDATPLNYPDTLDLSWPMPAPKPWNNSKNVGQFVWDRVNPNPSQWHNGVKLMHHIMSTQSQNEETVRQAMRTLGTMYHNLLEDYARSAFWFEQAGIDKNPSSYSHAGMQLADCYFRLGNKAMAEEILDKMSNYPYGVIKLLGDMGEARRALALAERFAKNNNAVVCFLYAGDVCRVSGDLEKAEEYYNKALQAAAADNRNESHANRDRKRAEASLAAIRFFRLSPQDVKDGTYQASSLGYEDQVAVEVVVKGGKIESVEVTKHREKQFYSSIAETPRRIIDRQSLVNVDTTTGATITSEAIINATAKALAQGQK